MSLCVWRTVNSDDRTHISSSRTLIIPVTYRCIIKITNGHFRHCVEVCNKGFIKQQERQRQGHSPAKFKTPQPRLPLPLDERLPGPKLDVGPSSLNPALSFAHTQSRKCPSVCVRYNVLDMNTHRWNSVLENNN